MDWMAWTWPTAAFFAIIALLLVIFTVLAVKFPETPRVGILRTETTRGDRLFVTLLGTAAVAWIDVADLSLIGGIMPRLAIAILAVSCLLEIARCVMHRPLWQNQAMRQQGLWLVGFFALVATMVLLGFITAATLFCLTFLLVIVRRYKLGDR